jgi:hypothetical protein
MNKKIMKAVGVGALAILILTGCARVWVSAQNVPQNETGLVGSWDIKITIRDCQSGAALASFPTMMTFNQGGTMQEAANDATPLLRLAGHGIWRHGTGPTFSRAFHFFRYDANGTFAGTAKITGQMELDQRGNALSGTSSFDFFDPNGNVVGTGCATETGTRFE